MSSSLIFLIQIYLLGWGAARRPQLIIAALAAAFFVLQFTAAMERGAAITSFVAVDALLVLTMLKLWTDFDSMRAWSVSLVGMCKIGLVWGYWSGLKLSWFGLLVVLDLAFIVQLLFAGGFVDRMGHNLDNLLWRFFPRRARMLRNAQR